MDLNKFKGLIPPIVTPFDENENLDEETTRREVKYLFNTGIDGISCSGSTGEGVVLSNKEIKNILQIINEENKNNIPVIAGIIKNSTEEALKTAYMAEDMGVDALLITPVFYYGNNFQGNYQYYKKIAEKIKLPIIIYNVVPTNKITPQEMAKLSEIKEVVGIKQVGTDSLTEMVSVGKNKFKVFSACDNILYGTYVSGACGAIAAIITAVPKLCVKQWQAYKSGDQETAQLIHERLFHVYKAYSEKPYPGKLKELLKQLGRPVGKPRSPILEPEEKVKKEIKRRLELADLL